MTKYKITMEVETFVKPTLLGDSSFKYDFMSDLRHYLDVGINGDNFDGVDNNILSLPDGTLRHFSTRFNLQAIETDEKEVPVDLVELE